MSKKKKVEELYSMALWAIENTDVEITVPYTYDGIRTNYVVSPYGTVYSVGKNGNKTPISGKIDSRTGRSVVKIRVEDESLTLPVDAMIADMFLPRKKNLHYIKHRDGRKRNNCLTNLEWCDDEEYMACADFLVDEGITDEILENISHDLESNRGTIQELANGYGVAESTIRDMIYYGLYSDITRKYNISNYVLDEEPSGGPVAFKAWEI